MDDSTSPINAFRNTLYKLNLRDSREAFGIYLDVVRDFRFLPNKESMPQNFLAGRTRLNLASHFED